MSNRIRDDRQSRQNQRNEANKSNQVEQQRQSLGLIGQFKEYWSVIAKKFNRNQHPNFQFEEEIDIEQRVLNVAQSAQILPPQSAQSVEIVSRASFNSMKSLQSRKMSPQKFVKIKTTQWNEVQRVNKVARRVYALLSSVQDDHHQPINQIARSEGIIQSQCFYKHQPYKPKKQKLANIPSSILPRDTQKADPMKYFKDHRDSVGLSINSGLIGSTQQENNIRPREEIFNSYKGLLLVPENTSSEDKNSEVKARRSKIFLIELDMDEKEIQHRILQQVSDDFEKLKESRKAKQSVIVDEMKQSVARVEPIKIQSAKSSTLKATPQHPPQPSPVRSEQNILPEQPEKIQSKPTSVVKAQAINDEPINLITSQSQQKQSKSKNEVTQDSKNQAEQNIINQFAIIPQDQKKSVGKSMEIQIPSPQNNVFTSQPVQHEERINPFLSGQSSSDNFLPQWANTVTQYNQGAQSAPQIQQSIFSNNTQNLFQTQQQQQQIQQQIALPTFNPYLQQPSNDIFSNNQNKTSQFPHDQGKMNSFPNDQQNKINLFSTNQNNNNNSYEQNKNNMFTQPMPNSIFSTSQNTSNNQMRNSSQTYNQNDDWGNQPNQISQSQNTNPMFPWSNQYQTPHQNDQMKQESANSRLSSMSFGNQQETKIFNQPQQQPSNPFLGGGTSFTQGSDQAASLFTSKYVNLQQQQPQQQVSLFNDQIQQQAVNRQSTDSEKKKINLLKQNLRNVNSNNNRID